MVTMGAGTGAPSTSMTGLVPALRTAAQASLVLAALMTSGHGAVADEGAFARHDQGADVGSGSSFPALVMTSGASKTLFIWGVGAEDEDSTTQYRPEIRFRGNFAGQCRYALDKIGRMLATRGGSLADATVLRAYLTDGRDTSEFYKCVDESYKAGSPRPAITTASISQLAHSGMLLEIEATASLPDLAKEPGFSIFRNTETVGKWNLGATEVLEVSGPARTVYVSGLQAVDLKAGDGKVSMFPQDFAGQCAFVQARMKLLLQHQGAAIDNVIRSTTFVTGDVSQPDSARCRAALPKEDIVRVPGTLVNVPQLAAMGEVLTYDIVAMAPLSARDDGTVFSKTVIPSELDPVVPAAIMVMGPRRTLDVAGVGARDATGAAMLRGDFMGQCRAAVGQIRALLGARQAGLDDVTKMLVFLTDSRQMPDYRSCMAQEFGNATQPAQTVVNVARLPSPGMLIQISATAVTAP